MLKALRMALALDPYDGQAHLMLGIYYMYVGNMEQGLTEHDKALSLNPNDADALLLAAMDLPFFGRPEQAAELADRAVRLNPSYPDWYNSGLLLAYFYARQFDRAITVTRSTISPSMWDRVYRPLLYAQADRDDDAKSAVSDLVQRDSDYSAERWLSDVGTFVRDIELNFFLESHRKAGLPVCASEAQLKKYPDMTRLPLCEQQRLKS
jgi:tetratricopeptide (TPR) repeat protein